MIDPLRLDLDTFSQLLNIRTIVINSLLSERKVFPDVGFSTSRATARRKENYGLHFTTSKTLFQHHFSFHFILPSDLSMEPLARIYKKHCCRYVCSAMMKRQQQKSFSSSTHIVSKKVLCSCGVRKSKENGTSHLLNSFSLCKGSTACSMSQLALREREKHFNGKTFSYPTRTSLGFSALWRTQTEKHFMNGMGRWNLTDLMAK